MEKYKVLEALSLAGNTPEDAPTQHEVGTIIELDEQTAASLGNKVEKVVETPPTPPETPAAPPAGVTQQPGDGTQTPPPGAVPAKEAPKQTGFVGGHTMKDN